MSGARCPWGCAGDIEVYTTSGGSHAAGCGACEMMGPLRPTEEAALTAFGRLAVFDPRERLPTPEEEAAHRARWGEGVGWMSQCLIDGNWTPPRFSARRWGSVHGHPVMCWPVTADGRPVAWPEVS